MPGSSSPTRLPREPRRRPGDLTYYAPWGNLAVFYHDASYAQGLVPRADSAPAWTTSPGTSAPSRAASKPSTDRTSTAHKEAVVMARASSFSALPEASAPARCAGSPGAAAGPSPCAVSRGRPTSSPRRVPPPSSVT
ncbi:cyclophilin-like fold protein [Streptomyces sp. NPDC006622]|uniref:cyclophilin-like fold protein n=1 Tax=Streptomyces sp. NPDC006622 TaxID=3155459 RepID=UPI0033A23ACB